MGEEKAMVVRIGAVAGGLDRSALLLHLLQLLLHTTHSLSPLRIQLITIQILLQTTHPRLSSHLISSHSIPFHSIPFHSIPSLSFPIFCSILLLLHRCFSCLIHSSNQFVDLFLSVTIISSLSVVNSLLSISTQW